MIKTPINILNSSLTSNIANMSTSTFFNIELWYSPTQSSPSLSSSVTISSPTSVFSHWWHLHDGVRGRLAFLREHHDVAALLARANDSHPYNLETPFCPPPSVATSNINCGHTTHTTGPLAYTFYLFLSEIKWWYFEGDVGLNNCHVRQWSTIFWSSACFSLSYRWSLRRWALCILWTTGGHQISKSKAVSSSNYLTFDDISAELPEYRSILTKKLLHVTKQGQLWPKRAIHM